LVAATTLEAAEGCAVHHNSGRFRRDDYDAVVRQLMEAERADSILIPVVLTYRDPPRRHGLSHGRLLPSPAVRRVLPPPPAAPPNPQRGVARRQRHPVCAHRDPPPMHQQAAGNAAQPSVPAAAGGFGVHAPDETASGVPDAVRAATAAVPDASSIQPASGMNIAVPNAVVLAAGGARDPLAGRPRPLPVGAGNGRRRGRVLRRPRSRAVRVRSGRQDPVGGGRTEGGGGAGGAAPPPGAAAGERPGAGAGERRSGAGVGRTAARGGDDGGRRSTARDGRTARPHIRGAGAAAGERSRESGGNHRRSDEWRRTNYSPSNPRSWTAVARVKDDLAEKFRTAQTARCATERELEGLRSRYGEEAALRR